jgi:hypothetical protein
MVEFFRTVIAAPVKLDNTFSQEGEVFDFSALSDKLLFISCITYKVNFYPTFPTVGNHVVTGH